MASDLTSLTRYSDRRVIDRAALNRLLDQCLTGTLGAVSDGEPWLIPILFARDGDRLIFHGSTGAGLLRHAAGSPVAFSVHTLDGLKLGETMKNTGAQYRSAVIRGALTRLTGSEASAALDVFNERVLPGRAAEVPPATTRELAATMVVTLGIEPDNWIMKAATGEVEEPAGGTDIWCGTIEMGATASEPASASWAGAATPSPAAESFVRSVNAGRVLP